MQIKIDKLKMLGYSIAEEMHNSICLKDNKVKILPLIGEPIEIQSKVGSKLSVYSRKMGNAHATGCILYVNADKPNSDVIVTRDGRKQTFDRTLNIYLRNCTAIICKYMCQINQYTIQIGNIYTDKNEEFVGIVVVNDEEKSIKKTAIKLCYTQKVVLFDDKMESIKVELAIGNRFTAVRIESYIICIETGVQTNEIEEPMIMNMVFVENTETNELFALNKEEKTMLSLKTGIRSKCTTINDNYIEYNEFNSNETKTMCINRIKTAQKTESTIIFNVVFKKSVII